MTIHVHPEQRAWDEFKPLMDAIRERLPEREDYTLAVENTGGHIYCMFVRHQNDNRAPVDRCVVFSELGFNEPDPTASSRATVGLYRDWNDDSEDWLLYEEASGAFRYDADHVDRIAAWAVPLIRGWLEVPR